MNIFEKLTVALFLPVVLMYLDSSNLVQGIGSSSPAAITEECLTCLCHAATGCNITISCRQNGRFCGPFDISKPYWEDSGKLKLSESSDSENKEFQDCVQDPICATETVRNHMSKYGKDCNNDGLINCDDFVLIHLLGRDGCASDPKFDSFFIKRYLHCRSKMSGLQL